MSSTYLRLAAPLQSWAGERLTGNVVATNPLPPHRALVGLLAACFGYKRGEWEPWLYGVNFRLRVDNSGVIISEFQTINPRDEDLDFQQRIHVALTGTKWGLVSHFTPDAEKGTSVVRRTYVSGGEFLVEIMPHERGEDIYRALRFPVYSPYLGKKAFPPVFPFLLGKGEQGLLDKTIPVLELASHKDAFAYKTQRTLAMELENGAMPITENDQGQKENNKNLRLYTLTQDNVNEWELVTAPVVKERSVWLEKIQDSLYIDAVK